MQFRLNGNVVTLNLSIKEAKIKLKKHRYDGLQISEPIDDPNFEDIKQLKIAEAKLEEWHKGNIKLIRRMFTGDELLKEYHYYNKLSLGKNFYNGPLFWERVEKFLERSTDFRGGLNSIIDILTTLEEHENSDVIPSFDTHPQNRKKVFIAYGHQKEKKTG